MNTQRNVYEPSVLQKEHVKSGRNIILEESGDIIRDMGIDWSNFTSCASNKNNLHEIYLNLDKVDLNEPSMIE